MIGLRRGREGHLDRGRVDKLGEGLCIEITLT